MKNVLSKLLVMVFIINLFAGVSLSEFTAAADSPATITGNPVGTGNVTSPITFTGSGVTLEAEDFVLDNYDLVNGQYEPRFKIYADELSSGGKSVYSSRVDLTVPANDARADFDLSFVAPNAGTYYVWARVKKTSWPSCFLSVGENAPYSYLGLTESTDYVWVMVNSGPVESGATKYVRIMRRHDYVYYDKFIITNNVDIGPIGKDATHLGNGEDGGLPSGVYPVPSFAPTGEHPNIWFKAADVPTIKANMQTAEHAAYYQEFLKLAAAGVPIQSSYSAENLCRIEARAFDYAINGNETRGHQAYELFMAHSKIAEYSKAPFPYRSMAHLVVTGAKVYDWCYDLLTVEERAALLRRLEVRATHLEVGYPPTLGGSVSGHSGEEPIFSALIALSLASYSERPDIYNYVVGRVMKEFVPVRNYVYQSHSHHQGIDYGAGTRFGWELQAAYMIYKATGVHIFNYENMSKVLYEYIYNIRPDGQAARIGDSFVQSQDRSLAWIVSDDYWDSYMPSFFVGAAYFKDPYIKREAARQNQNHENKIIGNSGEFSPTMFLAMNDPTLETKSYDTLPLSKYYAWPKGAMSARTGWSDGIDSPDVVAYMKMGALWGGNHDHLDMGNFTLYYKGSLAIDSGYYDTYGGPHWSKYYGAGIAHNIVTVYDPNEVVPSNRKNDGGYRWPNNGGEAQDYNKWLTSGQYNMVGITAHEIGPDTYTPEYSYIAGNLSNTYSDKVTSSTRSMVFLPLEDENHPAALVVMDSVTSKDASLKKSWLLHMQEEPVVTGNKTIVTRTQDGYNGRMVNETLLPKKAEITKIGGPGKQYWVVDENFPTSVTPYKTAETGWGRVEVSPSSANETDCFLNVMTVSDADTTAPDIQSTLIEANEFVGAAFGGRAVIFNKNSTPLSLLALVQKREFTVPAGTQKVLICGLKSGTWTVNGTKVVASGEGGCVWANISSTTVTLKYSGSASQKAFTSNKPTEKNKIGIKKDYKYLYSHTDPIVNGENVLIDMYSIMKGLGAEVSRGANGSVTASLAGTTMSVNSGAASASVNGIATSLDCAAEPVNGDLMIPITALEQVFGYSISEEPYSGVLILSKN